MPVLPNGKREGMPQVGRHSRPDSRRQPVPDPRRQPVPDPRRQPPRDPRRQPPPHARRRPAWRRPAFRRALVAIFVLVVLAAGGAYYYLRGHRPPPSPPRTPLRAIQEAASQAAALTSVSATFTTQVGGLTVLFGTVQEQVRPTPLSSLAMTTVDGTDRFAVNEIVTNSEVYLAIPALAQETGKPWVGVPVTELTADPALAEIAATSAIPTSQAALLAQASQVRHAGSGTVGRVRTSRYVATVAPTTLAGLSPALKRLLAPELKSVSGLISFVAWIDRQHNLREIQTTAVIGGQRTVTTIVWTATNQAVQISVPTAGQVTAAPFSGLPPA